MGVGGVWVYKIIGECLWEGCGVSSQVWCSMLLHCRLIHGVVLQGLMGYLRVLQGKLACHSLIHGLEC